jgi:pSer/pThr/pTyr-binding forkhead associated (FHA) protein
MADSTESIRDRKRNASVLHTYATTDAMVGRIIADLPEDALALDAPDRMPGPPPTAAAPAMTEIPATSTSPSAPLPLLWSERVLTVTVSDASGERTVHLATPFARIGSLPGADIVLPSDDVPPRALYLHATEKGIFCLPLVEPTEHAKLFHGWLQRGQWLTLGPYQLCAELDGAAATQSDPPEPQNEGPALDAKLLAEPTQPSIVVSHHGRHLETRSLARPLTILGRTRPSTVRVRDPGLSGCHCALYWTGKAMWIIDLASTGGTSFADAAIAAGPLPPGERFQAGNVEIALCKPGEASGAPLQRGRQLASLQSPRDEGPAAQELRQLREQAARLAGELEQTRATHADAESALRERLGRLTATLTQQQDAFAQERGDGENERRRLKSLLAQSEERSESLKSRLEREAQEHQFLLERLRDESAQHKASWERDRTALEAEIARISQNLHAVHEERSQDKTSHLALISRLERELSEKSAEIENLRRQVDQQQQSNDQRATALQCALTQFETAAQESSAAWEVERNRLELLAAEERSGRSRLEQESARANQLHREEMARIQDSFRQREAVLNEEIQQLRRSIQAHETAACENAEAWDKERRHQKALAGEVETRLRKLESELEIAQQAHQMETARLQLALSAREAMPNEAPDLPAPKWPAESVEQESAQGLNREEWEREDHLLQARPTDQDSHDPETDRAEFDLTPDDGAELTGATDVEAAEAPRRVEFALPKNADATAGVELDDPEALNRMVRFARQKRGRLIPAVRTTALYVLWGSAIAVTLAAVLFLAGRFAQEYWP